MSRLFRVGMIGLATISLMITIAPPSQALHPHERNGIMVGVSLGRGESDIELGPLFADALPPGATPPRTGWTEGYSPGFKVGYGIGNHFMISFENRQWLDEGAVTSDSLQHVDKLRVNTQHYSFMLTVYPASPKSPAGGIYIQAGMGWSNSRFTILEPLIPANEWGENFEELEKVDEAGTAYSVGVGFEFRIVKRVAAGVATSFNYLDTGGQLFAKSEFIPMTWTLNWYW